LECSHNITIKLVNIDGNPVQIDDKLLTVFVEQKFLSIDNGELCRYDSFAGNKSPIYLGKALIIIQPTYKDGKKVKVEMEGAIEPVYVNIQSK
jgi:hypothetical protein